MLLLGGMIMTSGCSTENPAVSESSSEAETTTSESLTETTAATTLDPNAKYAALTFDDGPNTVTTPLVLDKLEKYGITGSFFVIGNNITEKSEPVLKRAYDMGCEIDNHSRTHSYMNKMEAADIAEEIKYTSDKVEEITGEPTRFFRPPYIAVNQTMFDSVDLPFICGYGANDWDAKVTADERAEKILAQAKDGCIILLHDMEGNTQTVEALDTIIPEMQKQGYVFVTVTQLFEVKNVEIKPDTDIVYSYAEQTSMYS